MKQIWGHYGEEWICYFFFVGWWCISLGFHVDLESPNIEIHVPFGFVRIGKKGTPRSVLLINEIM